MKKAKFDFGEGGIQGFCIRHVEKFVLGVVAVLLIGFIYLGISAPALDADKSPDDLSQKVTNAESTLVRTKWDDVKAERTKNVTFTTEKDVLFGQRPVDPSAYSIAQIFNKPPFPRLKPRTDPKIFAPVAVRVLPIYGALHTSDDKDPQTDLTSVTIAGGGRKRVKDGTYKPDQTDGGYRSTYMMVITAAVPYGKQYREYERALQNSPDYRPESRDDVQYLEAYVQRAEVNSDSDVPAAKDWIYIKTLDWKKNYRAIVGESTQEASLDPVSDENPRAITQPVPPILVADLSEALKHPDIPLRKLADMGNFGMPRATEEEASEEEDTSPDDSPPMPEDAIEPPAGDEPPDSASVLDRAIAEEYTLTARQIPTRQTGKKQPKPKPGKPGKAGSRPPTGAYGSPLGSAAGSSGPPGMSGGMGMMPGMMPGSMLGSSTGSSGPPGMSGGMGPGVMPGMPMPGGMGAMAGRPGMAGMPGAFNQIRQVVPWKLLRFVDATVEPGKKYKYRVRLSVADPNRPKEKSLAPESGFLAVEVKERLRKLDAGDEKSKKRTYYRYSDFSEASSAASLPALTTVLAGATGGQSTVSVAAEGRELDCPVGDQTLKVLAVVWDKPLATHVPGETIVTHGSVMHFNKKGLTKDESNKERSVHVVNPLAGDLRVIEKGYDWKSLSQVLDIQGGVSLSGIRRPSGAAKSASEALLVDESGNLVVIDEFSSFEKYSEFSYEATEEAGAFPGAPGGPGFGAPPFGDEEGGAYGAPPTFGLGPPSGPSGKARPKK